MDRTWIGLGVACPKEPVPVEAYCDTLVHNLTDVEPTTADPICRGAKAVAVVVAKVAAAAAAAKAAVAAAKAAVAAAKAAFVVVC